jgi:molybdopterin adenylyltransferase
MSEAALKIGLVSVSDRASQGVYQDQGIPALSEWLSSAISGVFSSAIAGSGACQVQYETRLIADERSDIEACLIDLVDNCRCHLVLTTGGTGPSRRDVTPEATLAVATREMPGFGEQMRQISLKFVPTAILSRQVGVLREIGQPGTPDAHAALILNLPGQPKAIRETLEGLKDGSGNSVASGIFAAVPYCIDLIGGPYIETDPALCKAFRPKSAQRPAGSTGST